MNGLPEGDAAPSAPVGMTDAAPSPIHSLLDASAEALLLVDAAGREVLAFNRALAEEWQIPEELLASREAARIHAFMAGEVRDSAAYLERVRQIEGSTDAVTGEAVERRDGRVYDRSSWLEGQGRVWRFRDISDRRQAEAARETAEASYRTIFDLASEAMYVHDARTGAIVDVNERAVEFHGRSREEFLRMGIAVVSAGEAPYSEVEALERVLRAAAGEPQLFLWRATHSSGKQLWIEVSLRAAVIEGVERVLGTARNVTDRMDAQATLQRSQEELERAVAERTAELAAAHAAVREREEQYRALADADPDGIVVIDDASTIVSVNPAMATIFGYEAEEMVGQPLPMLMPDALRESHQAGVQRYLASGRRTFPWVGVQVPGKRKDGATVDLEINFGEYSVDGRHRFAGFIHDITERKRADEALRFQSTLLEAQNDAAIDGILVAHEGQVLSMNRRYAEIFNVPAELRPLDRCAEMFRWAVGQTADPESYLASIERLRHDAESTHRDEVLLADGRVLDRYSAPIRSPEGKLYGRIWVIRDITERKRIEEALQRAKEEAERANLAKSEFLSRMSHELRTPLNSILGFGQVLGRRELQPEQQRAVDHIMKAGRHLLNLIDEVLDIARIESNRQQLSLEPVHTGALLEEALALIRPVAQQRSVHIPLRAPEAADVHVRADRQRLMQVVLNLFSNAVKYNSVGGKVELVARREDEGEGAARLLFGVRDTGPGIPAERMSELFVPFSRLGAEHEGVEGTGLGLALSQRLVEAMNGELRVESTLHEGSTFWVELPLAPHPMTPLESYRQTVSAQAGRASAAGPRRVLYVEDNLANLNLVESIFEDRPEIQLLPALQGRLGLELAREHTPDLILLDLHLPDMTGEDVLRELRGDSRTSGIPVLVISADATPRQIGRLQVAGAQGYLTKPIDVDEFLAAVDSALAAT